MEKQLRICPSCDFSQQAINNECQNCGFDLTRVEPMMRDDTATSYKRRPIVALVLSLVVSGLGQTYNGQLKKGLTFYLAMGFLVGFLIAVLVGNFYGMLIACAIILGSKIFILIEAVYSARRIGQVTLKRYNRWYVYAVIALISGYVVYPLASSAIKNNLYTAYKIPSGAMGPTLLVGDHLVADMGYPAKDEPQRGDIIIFKFPPDPSKDFIKRIIGLPGEQIEITDRKIYIDGKLFDDKYGHYETQSWGSSTGRCPYCSVTVPNDHYFVMGDNRDNSQDSRYWGFVPLKSIRGKALYIYWAKYSNRIGMEIE
jgi:signal peptidase I